MADHNEILEAANDIIKNVTPGNPNAMTASNKAIALALISIAQDVHAMRGDMDEMRKMTRTLDEIRGRLNFRRWQDAKPTPATLLIVNGWFAGQAVKQARRSN